jgi:hypothetical protein
VPAAAAVVELYLDVSIIPLAFCFRAAEERDQRPQDTDRGSRMTGRGDGLAERLRDLDEPTTQKAVVRTA